MPKRLRNRLAAGVAAVSVLTATGVTIGGRPAFAVNGQNCPAESYPPANTPRNATGAPYKAPFTASLNGGNLAIAVPGAVGVTFGAKTAQYPNGTLFGSACGLLTLPSLAGPIAANPPGDAASGNPNFNNNFVLYGPNGKGSPVPVSLTIAGTGVPLLDGYGSAAGTIQASILRPAAANGGLNLMFTTTTKATAAIDPGELAALLPTVASLPPAVQQVLGGIAGAGSAALNGECTIATGDLSQTGLPAKDVGAYTQAMTLSTDPNTTGGNGKPLTGPVTNGQAVAYDGSIAVAPVSSDMPPSPNAPNATEPPATLCSAASVTLFNTLLGLTSPNNPTPAQLAAGAASAVKFDAPITISTHLTDPDPGIP